MKRSNPFLFTACCSILLTAGACTPMTDATSRLQTVDNVDIERYAGLWYEIARYPNGFQTQCAGGTTAEYIIRDNGDVTVINRCNVGSLDGEVDTQEGFAQVVDEDTNAKLVVYFFFPFGGDYWIIDLDEENYEWAVVGEPSRSFLWILSRSPELDDDVMNGILERLPDQGYDPDRLQMTPQNTSS